MADAQSLRRDIKKLKGLHYRNTTFHDRAFDKVHSDLCDHGKKIDELVRTIESLQDDIRAHTKTLDLVKALTDTNRDLKKQNKAFEVKIESQTAKITQMKETIKAYDFATESTGSPSASASALASGTLTPGSIARQSQTPSPPPSLHRVSQGLKSSKGSKLEVADIQQGIAQITISDER